MTTEHTATPITIFTQECWQRKAHRTTEALAGLQDKTGIVVEGHNQKDLLGPDKLRAQPCMGQLIAHKSLFVLRGQIQHEDLSDDETQSGLHRYILSNTYIFRPIPSHFWITGTHSSS